MASLRGSSPRASRVHCLHVLVPGLCAALQTTCSLQPTSPIRPIRRPPPSPRLPALIQCPKLGVRTDHMCMHSRWAWGPCTCIIVTQTPAIAGPPPTRRTATPTAPAHAYGPLTAGAAFAERPGGSSKAQGRSQSLRPARSGLPQQFPPHHCSLDLRQQPLPPVLGRASSKKAPGLVTEA